MSTSKRSITVARNYNPTPDACVRALRSLLDQSVTKLALKHSQPGGFDDVREGEGAHTTKRKYT
jgi:hypothetical protein